MVKRVPTSPLVEDEPKYLTVVNPYPLYATMEQFEDQKDLVRWLSCCTGKDVLYTFFCKPSAGMVILEVDQHFDGYDRLLGAHKWSEFLKTPSEEDKDQVAKIFYCTYDTGRGLRANGWKRVEIEEHWFHGWSANNLTSPYPPSSYCEVPPENPIVGPLCRPLPAASFPLPRAWVPPVCSARRRQAQDCAAFSAHQKLSKPTSAAGWITGSLKSQSGASRSGRANESEAFVARSNGSTRASVPIAKLASSNPRAKVPLALKSSTPCLMFGVFLARSPTFTTPHSATNLDEDEDDLLPSVRSLVSSTLNSDATPGSSSTWSQRDGGTDDVHDPGEADDGTPPWSNYAMPREDKLLPWKQNCPLHNVLCRAGICEKRLTAAAAKRKEEERLQRQKEREDRARRRKSKKGKADKGHDDSDEDCPWDGESVIPSPADGSENAEDAQARNDQDNKNEISACDDISDGKSTTPSVQNGCAKGKDAVFDSGDVDPWADSPTACGDEARGTVSPVARTANAKKCSNNSTPWDNSTSGPNINSTSGYPAADNEVGFARGQRSNFPSPWDASVKSGPGSHAPSAASRSGWMEVSKGPW